MKQTRSALLWLAGTLALTALSGCATAPADDLLASTPIVRELWRERGPVVNAARFSRFQPGEDLPPGWEPWGLASGKHRTEYRLVDSTRGTVLEAFADGAATGLYRKIRISPQRHPFVEWQWRIEQLVPGSGARMAPHDDAPARLVVSFHGDPEKLDFDQRTKLRLAKAIAGEPLPYAMLIYVWSSDLPVESVIPNPLIDRIRTVVVEAGTENLGKWRTYRRNVLDDYRRIFREEPDDIVAVGVLTDADNTKQTAHALYGDIIFRSP